MEQILPASYNNGRNDLAVSENLGPLFSCQYLSCCICGPRNSKLDVMLFTDQMEVMVGSEC